MEKTVIYVSILAFIGIVTLIICLGMTAGSDDSVVANVNVDNVNNLENETIGIILNTKDGLVLDTSLNNLTILTETDVDNMLTRRRLYNNPAGTNNRPDIISVNLPSVKTIGDNTFDSCTSLTSVNFANVTTIGDSGFFGCKLTSINFPNVTTIGDSAFKSCTSLTSINFPNVTTIRNSAFRTCFGLTSINFPNVTTIGNSAFESCFGLTSINFPNVTTIGNSVFNSCTSLTSVILNNVTTIRDSAFNSCSNLTSVILNNVTTIGVLAFGGCHNLTSITFPTTVTLNGSAGNEVFESCYRLGEGTSTLTVNPASDFVIPTGDDNNNGISRGRKAAIYNNGIIRFDPG